MKIYFLISILLINFACVKKTKTMFLSQEIEAVCNINGEVVNSSLMMTVARDIVVFRNYIIVRSFTGNKYLHVLDKNTGEMITSLVSKGDGPGEVADLSDQIHVDDAGCLFWFDNNKRKLFYSNIDSIINNSVGFCSADFCNHADFMDAVWKVDDKYLIQVGDRYLENNNTKRYAIGDAKKIYNSYSGFPIVSDDIRTLEQIYTHYRTSQHLALSPDQDKFAIGEIYGGILEIFHIGDSITLNSIHPMYAYKDNELHGFVDLCVTDSSIYAIKIDSSLDGSNPQNRFNQILVFDWEGQLVKKYETDYNLSTLCVDETSGCIYAVGQSLSSESELQVVSFKI